MRQIGAADEFTTLQEAIDELPEDAKKRIVYVDSSMTTEKFPLLDDNEGLRRLLSYCKELNEVLVGGEYGVILLLSCKYEYRYKYLTYKHMVYDFAVSPYDSVYDVLRRAQYKEVGTCYWILDKVRYALRKRFRRDEVDYSENLYKPYESTRLFV